MSDADRRILFETELGWIGLVASKLGLKAVIGPEATRNTIEEESRELFGDLAEDDKSLTELARSFESYARGEDVSLDWPLDTDGATPFQRSVWEVLQKIPRGEVRTYGQVAAAVGSPGGARAVGQAVGSNPFAISVPCHRVVAGDGALTGFGGGLAVKERLLLIEGWAQASAQRRRTERRKGFRPARRDRMRMDRIMELGEEPFSGIESVHQPKLL
jgi:methylated-DNA-[protein]-cysteine S-methyltransferase